MYICIYVQVDQGVNLDVHNLMSDLEQIPLFDRCMIGCKSKKYIKKTYVDKRLDYVLKMG